MEEEKIVIHCPNCSSSKLLQGVPEMTVEKEYIFCPKCGLVLKLIWIVKTAEILNSIKFVSMYQDQLIAEKK